MAADPAFTQAGLCLSGQRSRYLPVAFPALGGAISRAPEGQQQCRGGHVILLSKTVELADVVVYKA
jgi:hypothetical protein